MTKLRALLDAGLARLARVGADPQDDDETRLRKALLPLIAILILPISFLWAFLYLSFGVWSGSVALLYSVISIASMVVYARTHDFDMLLRIQLLAILLSPTLSMIPLGGFLPGGGVGIWGIMAPLGALVFGDVRSGIRWFGAFLVVFLGSGIAGILGGFTSTLPEWFSSTMLALNITVGGTMMFTLLALFAKQRADAQAALRTEQERSERLLRNVLPEPIAERLKTGPQTIADDFRAATVLFADVVEFTPRSERLEPAALVGLLDQLFGHFDELADRYGLEKIKTIGDSYMAAGGVPTPRPDHAAAVAQFALDMLAATQPGGAIGDLGIRLRIGINSGPVVAGVIGRKRFLYDLWGDVVNTASRMESQGTPGCIQVTGATCELLRDDFVLEPRGQIAVKGKGDMETWYLLARRAARTAAGDSAPATTTAAPDTRTAASAVGRAP